MEYIIAFLTTIMAALNIIASFFADDDIVVIKYLLWAVLFTVLSTGLIPSV
jgi:branched-subunit amino acid permease